MIGFKKTLGVVFLTFVLTCTSSVLAFHLSIGMTRFSVSFEVLHVPVWVPYLTCFLIFGCLLLVVKDKFRSVSATAMIFIFLFHILALRVLVFNPVDGEVEEIWTGISMSKIDLGNLDEQIFCYSLDSTTFEIRSDNDQKGLTFYKFFWPATAVESRVVKEFATLKRC